MVAPLTYAKLSISLRSVVMSDISPRTLRVSA